MLDELVLLRIAALAAMVASAGDLLMLYVINAARPDLALPEPGRGWLWLGGVLGVVAIPVYAVGYRAVSRVVAQASAAAGELLFLAAAAGSLVGAGIHGLTALHIEAELDAGVGAIDPLVSMTCAGPLLLGLWVVAAVLLAGACGLFSWFVGRGETVLPRRTALANPVLLTIVLAVIGLPSLVLRSFLTPAAPNLAHVIFFLVCMRLLPRSR